MFVKQPDSANVMTQAIGRVYCIGQTRQQTIFVLTTNYLYDQVQQANTARKIYGQIAGSSNIRLRKEDVIAHMATIAKEELQDEDEDAEPLTEEARVNKAKGQLQHEIVVNMYMRAFGQQTARDRWGNTWNPTEKDSLESERQIDRIITGKRVPQVDKCRVGPNSPGRHLSTYTASKG